MFPSSNPNPNNPIITDSDPISSINQSFNFLDGSEFNMGIPKGNNRRPRFMKLSRRTEKVEIFKGGESNLGAGVSGFDDGSGLKSGNCDGFDFGSKNSGSVLGFDDGSGQKSSSSLKNDKCDGFVFGGKNRCSVTGFDNGSVLKSGSSSLKSDSCDGFAFGGKNSSSVLGFDDGSGLKSGSSGLKSDNCDGFVFGRKNSSSLLGFDDGSGLKSSSSFKSDGFVFGANNSGSVSNANAGVLGFDDGSFCKSASDCNGFRFGANLSGSVSNANPGVLRFDDGSVLKSSSSLKSNRNGFVFGGGSSSSVKNDHVEFVFKGDKSRDNECFEFGGGKGSGTGNLDSEKNGFVNGENLKFGFDNRKVGLSSDRGNDVFEFGGSKCPKSGNGGFEFGKKMDGLFGNLNMDRERFGFGAKTNNADVVNTKDQGASVFPSTLFEFGINSNSFSKECGAKEYETRGASENSEGKIREEPEIKLDSDARNNACSESKTSREDTVGVSGTDKLGGNENLSTSGKGNDTCNNLEESLLSKLSDEMKRFTVHDGEATARVDKVENCANFFVNFDTTFVMGSNQNSFGVPIERDGVNNRSVRGKLAKKSKSKFGRGLMAQQQSEKDNVPKRDSSFQTNDNSPGCHSPMDFSPNRPTEAAASGLKGNTNRQGHDACGNDEGSTGNQPSDYFTDCLNRSNGELGGDFSKSSTGQDGLSAIRQQYKKKYKLKVGNGLNDINQSQKAASNSASKQSSTTPSSSSKTKKTPNYKIKSKNTGYIFQERARPGTTDVTSEQACDDCRIKGNQAYKDGDFSTAEEYYTKAINSVPDNSSMQPLLLCYSNRAATRMSLGRMREALSDCKTAAALDTSFVKAKLRAANCHLVLGEAKDAELYYNDCLGSERHVCLDRRITIEAAEGLQKAQKVDEYMRQCGQLLQKGSSDAANTALVVISEALKISCYSDKLFEMKGKALSMLLMHEEVIQLCEKTLHIAEKNFMTCHSPNVNGSYGHEVTPRLWRWSLMAKSHYQLGKLELALDIIEKHEQLEYTANKITKELSSLAVSIRQLLAHKKAGNEAFETGLHGEAVEHYTTAISKSVECRPFTAICFCNRAAAYQAMGQLIDAIADCSLAIALDQNYSKALSRRATLHELIRDYAQAANDLQRFIYLLENQPQKGFQESAVQKKSGGSSTKELQQARTHLSSVEKKLKKEASLDLYKILGVKASDAESDIKKAYRKAALRHHPDKAAQLLPRNDAGDDGKLWKEIVEKVHKDADRLFKMIGESYSVLSVPEKRLKYNDEEELRDVIRRNSRSSQSGKTSDFYDSPFRRSSYTGRRSDFNGSPFGRSNYRDWEEAYREYSNHHRW